MSIFEAAIVKEHLVIQFYSFESIDPTFTYALTVSYAYNEFK